MSKMSESQVLPHEHHHTQLETATVTHLPLEDMTLTCNWVQVSKKTHGLRSELPVAQPD